MKFFTKNLRKSVVFTARIKRSKNLSRSEIISASFWQKTHSTAVTTHSAILIKEFLDGK